MKTLIVTAADEAYAPLLGDLLDSLEPHRGPLNIAVACLDIGLSDASRSAIATRVDRVVAPPWPFRPHATFDANRRYLSRAARPFLPDLVPGYALYIWLDADVWVQDPLALRWLVEAGRTSEIAAAPVVHRCYAFTPRDVAWLFERYRMAFGEGIARELTPQPYINSGVMAIRAGSRLWRNYAERFQTALDQWQGQFLSDQAIVNATILLDDIQMQRLPAKVNWICHLSPPAWDETTKMLVEPALPFEPILIVHNTFDDKNAEHALRTLKGQPRGTRLTHSAIKLLRH